ncbi:DUF3040 domain-containing protein [Sinosporangium siamense]|uniref:DUF3040 domain-containing protein n=1 Tax=Sinosporangium siamense TaxID=1367973 RepID=A0A919RE81_9ACTN|nr:DUF3040 domain-containing protein [Sinosporangium siamense]GII90266.1 hypothetical protein Ssi02_04970 [Sinosporangium siamense]
MALSPHDQRVLGGIGDRLAADDPDLAARLRTFSTSPPAGPPSRLRMVPVAIAALLIAAGALVFPHLVDGDGAARPPATHSATTP